MVTTIGPYVADGAAGLRIIDVTNPVCTGAARIGRSAGTQKGVDVDPVRDLAVVGVGHHGLHIVDVANPAAPVVVGSLSGGDVRDVALQGSHAFLADNSRSLTSVDLSDPAIPILRNSTPRSLGGRLNDVVVQGNFALGADVLFVNGVPMVASIRPTIRCSRAILNFAALRDSDGQGIAADAGYVYLAAVAGSAFIENGTTGKQPAVHRPIHRDRGPRRHRADDFDHAAAAGASVIEGSSLSVRVNATTIWPSRQ